MQNEEPKAPPRPMGFAAMDPAKVSEIAGRGGRAAHAAGRAHQWDKAKATEAGRKGGLAVAARRRARAEADPACVSNEATPPKVRE